MSDSLDSLFSDIPKPVDNSEPLKATDEKRGRPKLSAEERLARKRSREEQKQNAAQPKAEELKLDLTEATKSVGGLLVAMSKTKKPLDENEIKGMSATAELSLAKVLQVENENTSKWIVHTQTAIVWVGTLLPRFFPDLFGRNHTESQTERKPE